MRASRGCRIQLDLAGRAPQPSTPGGKTRKPCRRFALRLCRRQYREAISAAGDSFVGAFERMYFRWPHPIVKRPPGRLTIERLAENRIVLGDPKSCVEEIIRFQRELGANHFICRFSVPGIPRDLCAQSPSLFTREVMPALLS